MHIVQKWRKWTKDNGYELDSDNLFIVGPVTRGIPVNPKITFVKMDKIPASYDGDMRLMRLAFLSSVARLGQLPGLYSCWPDPKEVSQQ